jgi:hypothetical protein
VGEHLKPGQGLRSARRACVHAGTREFSKQRIYGELECSGSRDRWVRPARESATKPVGKPDAGNPHVRFDERLGNGAAINCQCPRPSSTLPAAGFQPALAGCEDLHAPKSRLERRLHARLPARQGKPPHEGVSQLQFSTLRSARKSIPKTWHFLYRWLRSRPSARAVSVMR